MEIVMKPVRELVPYGRNPRKNEPAVKYVAESIKAFGFKVPIIIDQQGVVVAGHTRLLAAKKLGMEQVPCIVADDLSPEQIDAFRLADNKVTEFSIWDLPLLGDALSGLSMDMSVFGFDTDGLDGLDMDAMFTDQTGKEKPPKTATCPHCGETFEL